MLYHLVLCFINKLFPPFSYMIAWSYLSVDHQVISRQATINIGTIGHVAHGKSTVVKALSGVHTVRQGTDSSSYLLIRIQSLVPGSSSWLHRMPKCIPVVIGLLYFGHPPPPPLLLCTTTEMYIHKNIKAVNIFYIFCVIRYKVEISGKQLLFFFIMNISLIYNMFYMRIYFIVAKLPLFLWRRKSRSGDCGQVRSVAAPDPIFCISIQ